MLLSDEKITGKTRLVVWKIDEPQEYYEKTLPSYWLAEISEIKNPKKKLEQAAKYFLLVHFFKIFKLEKDENGKPFLPQKSLHISISHSHNLLTIMTSPENCAVDTEKVSEKISRLTGKFLNAAEISRFPADTSTLTLLWSCKETLYKWHNTAGIDYRNCFDIQHIDFTQQQITAMVNDKIKHLIFFRKIDDYFLTFTFQKPEML